MIPAYIFWPEDDTHCGLVIGWCIGSAIIVAGMLHPFDENKVEASLEALNKKIRVDFSEEGLELEILGECLKRAPNVGSVPLVCWKGLLESKLSNHRLTHMYYRRPKLWSGRYYSLDEIDLNILMAIQAPEEHATQRVQNNKVEITCAFSCKEHIRGGGISTPILKRMNLAHEFMSALSKGSIYLKQRNGVYSFFRPMFLLVLHMACSTRDKLLSVSKLAPWVQSSFAFAEQIDLRCEQIVFILQQIQYIGSIEEKNDNVASARYISTQNCIWLVLNDIIIGTAVGLFIMENRFFLSDILRSLSTRCLFDVLQKALIWLDNWPAGLKLNNELSRFLYLILHAALNCWKEVLVRAIKAFPFVIGVVGISGIFGLSMILALMSDLMSIMTVHITVAYRLIRVGYRNQLLMAKSLFNLFRGKRYNVLRKRLDDWDYDLDQLILGSMLFTLISFLFPTITVYYVLFALSRTILLLIRAVFEVALALLNHFPLFALMLRVKDPWRLPGGIVLRPYRHNRSNSSSYLIHSIPIKRSRILNQYAVLGLQLASYYSPWRLASKFLSGNQLDPIPQHYIRYTYGTKRELKKE